MSDAWRIIGLGSPLMGDDGVGLAVLEALKQRFLPERIELVDGGTAGLALLDLMAGAERVILIDAAEMGLPPGTIRRLTPDQVKFEERSSYSFHQANVAEVLLLGQEMGLLPAELVVFGIQPERIERSLNLSGPLANAVASVVTLILAETAQGH